MNFRDPEVSPAMHDIADLLTSHATPERRLAGIPGGLPAAFEQGLVHLRAHPGAADFSALLRAVQDYADGRELGTRVFVAMLTHWPAGVGHVEALVASRWGNLAGLQEIVDAWPTGELACIGGAVHRQLELLPDCQEAAAHAATARQALTVIGSVTLAEEVLRDLRRRCRRGEMDATRGHIEIARLLRDPRLPVADRPQRVREAIGEAARHCIRGPDLAALVDLAGSQHGNHPGSLVYAQGLVAETIENLEITHRQRMEALAEAGRAALYRLEHE